MGVADTIGQRHFADAVDQCVVVVLADQAQHHVERRGAACAGMHQTIDFIEIGKDICLGEGFGEAGQVFPVDGATLAG